MIQSALCCGPGASHEYSVYPYRPAEPWVPSILNLTRFRIMGFVLTSCTIAGALICHSAKTPRNPDEHRPAPKARWSKFVKSVDYTSLRTPSRLTKLDGSHASTGPNLQMMHRAGPSCAVSLRFRPLPDGKLLSSLVAGIYRCVMKLQLRRRFPGFFRHNRRIRKRKAGRNLQQHNCREQEH